MDSATWTYVLLLADWIVRIGLAMRIIMRRLPVGTSLAWLGVVLLFPFAGAIVYLTVGETRSGRRRARLAAIHEPYSKWVDDLRQRRAADGKGRHW